MNSIDQNQPEQNRKNLSGKEAIEKLQKTVKSAPNCFFCTAVTEGVWAGARPMNVRKVDDAGHVWFLSASDSEKDQDLVSDPTVKLYFQESTHSGFLCLDGRATVSRDRAKIEEFWEPVMKTWFTEGIDDPRISVIKVVPISGYYWDTKHGETVAGIKMLIGSMIGQTLDDSIQGTLSF